MVGAYLIKGLPLMALGMAGGALLTGAATPLPKVIDNCSVYKVNPRAVTSYVMKPPVQEAPKCEPTIVTVKQDCPVAQESAVTEETPRRKKRHRRYRWYGR